jgi:RNA polymerase sigma-70 factor (ECF subfamily)
VGGGSERDRAAFEQFCTEEYPRIVDAVAVTIGNADLAVDAVDEALARAWNRVLRGHDIESLAGWVRVVAINVGRDEHRRRATEKKYLPTLAPSISLDEDEWQGPIDVRSALDQLPPRQREVAVLYYISNLRIAEIAEELHLSRGTVKTTLARARVKMAAALRKAAQETHRDAC